MSSARVLDTKPFSANRTYDVHCPNCQQVVDTQSVNVAKLVWPKFKCKSCSHETRLVAHRPKLTDERGYVAYHEPTWQLLSQLQRQFEIPPRIN